MVLPKVITPSWPAPNNVRAFVSTRTGGVSQAPYDSLNLGQHVGDDQKHVAENRSLFSSHIQMPEPIFWLNQVHSTQVATLPTRRLPECADAAFTSSVHQVCAVLTADCLPVFFSNAAGSKVAVAHAGWRGLCGGILESTLRHFDAEETVFAWLGPAIGPNAFEVGGEVREAFVAVMSEAVDAFVPIYDGKWYGNLYLLAKQRLQACHKKCQVYGGEYCTFSDEETFFSYRRDGKTGRMASVIWISE